MTENANEKQRQFWNSGFGEKWVTFKADLETLHAPMTEPLLACAAIGPGMSVLDVGCGSGSVARRAAKLTGPEGAVTGVDISKVLLNSAQVSATEKRSAPISYLLADAQTHDFAPASFDRIVSRMGVMFFADPVMAFGYSPTECQSSQFSVGKFRLKMYKARESRVAPFGEANAA